MRIFIPAVIIIVAALASCGKTTVNNTPTVVNGRLEPKGATSYNYGTHLIQVDKQTAYLVESTTLNLDSYDGDSVQVSMMDMGYRINPGPELYNVTIIKPL